MHKGVRWVRVQIDQKLARQLAAKRMAAESTRLIARDFNVAITIAHCDNAARMRLQLTLPLLNAPQVRASVLAESRCDAPRPLVVAYTLLSGRRVADWEKDVGR
jgi:hypothetical protein